MGSDSGLFRAEYLALSPPLSLGKTVDLQFSRSVNLDLGFACMGFLGIALDL